MTPCLPPSRARRAAARWPGPSLTASARGVLWKAGRDGETLPSVEQRNWCEALSGSGLGAPGRSPLNDGIGVDQQLSGAGDQRHLVRLAGGGQALVEDLELVVPVKGGGKGGGVERLAQPLAAAVDVSGAGPPAAVVIVGRQPGERGALLAAHPADLGHPPQDRPRGRKADAVNASDQGEALCQVGG